MTTVLYISYDGMTDSLGQSQVLPYLKGLSKEGYEIHLLSFEKPNKFHQNKDLIQRICRENNIQWHPQKYTKKPPLLSTIKDVLKMRRIAKRLHKQHFFQIMHCRSYIPALIGLRMQKKYGLKFIFDMRGFWADERLEGKIWSRSNPIFKRIYNYFKKKEIAFFKNADYVISLTHNGKKEILSWKELQKSPPKITVIPCCVDLNLFDPKKIEKKEKTELQKQLRIKETDFILGYVGSIGTWYMLDEMLDFFNVLVKEKSTAKFLFVTGESEEFIRNKANKKGIASDAILVKSCIHSAVPLHISLFDLSLFFIRPTFSKKASSPTKQGEIMAMGIPLICNAGVGDTDDIVRKYNAGIVLENLKDKHYGDAISHLQNFDANSLNQGAHDYFSLEKGIERYREVYRLVST